jgi:hypothetical protein
MKQTSFKNTELEKPAAPGGQVQRLVMLWECPQCGYIATSEECIALHAFPHWTNYILGTNMSSKEKRREILEMAHEAIHLIKSEKGKDVLRELCRTA